MAHVSGGSDAEAQRVNEMYWSGTATVDDIVAELGISRSALYAAIEPVPAGMVCADCQERMVFTNRTARDRGVASCPGCGRVSERAEAGGERGASDSAGVEPGDVRGGDGGVPDWVGALRAVPPQRVALVGGAAALGVVLGAAATYLLKD